MAPAICIAARAGPQYDRYRDRDGDGGDHRRYRESDGIGQCWPVEELSMGSFVVLVPPPLSLILAWAADDGELHRGRDTAGPVIVTLAVSMGSRCR
jgi:hypothetical protein